MNVYEFRMRRVRRSHSTVSDVSVPVNEPQHAAKLLQSILNESDRERFVTISLNRRNDVIGYEITAVGGLAQVQVHPREVFKSAILANAAAIVVGHNHPSGNPTPSKDDLAITLRIAKAGLILGIPLLDHIVVTDTSWRSISELVDLSLTEIS